MRKLALVITLILIFTIPWETAITIEAVGTLTRLIGLCAAGVWLISVLVQGRLRNFRLYHVVVLFFMFYNVASIFWTSHYDLTLERVLTFTQLAILTWILWDLFNTPESLRAAMQAFIFGGYVAVASAVFNFISGQIISTYEIGRYTGADQNAVEFAMILSISLPFAWHLTSSQKEGSGSNFLRLINFAYIPAALFAIILTASRTSLVTIIPGLLYIVGTMSRIKFIYRFLVFVVLVSAVFIGQFYVPQATLDRLGTIGVSIASNDFGGRVVLWDESIQVFLGHPLLGIGSGSLAAPDQMGTVAHNSFLSILAELGILGFIQFLVILVIVLYQALKQPKPYSILWLTVFAIWLIGILSLTWEYAKPTWFILNIIMISAGIYSRRDKLVEESTISNNSISGPDAYSNKPKAAGANV